MIDVILVEDNPSDIYLIKYVLEDAEKKVNVKTITSGAEALLFIDSNPSIPHLFILDVNLPQYSGFDILKVLKQNINKKNIPVIVFTSSDNEKDRRIALELGASAFISKPYDFLEYANVVKGFIDIAGI